MNPGRRQAAFVAAIAAFVMLAAVVAGEAKQRMSDPDAHEILQAAAENPVSAADLLSSGWRDEDAIRALTTWADTTAPEILWRLARSRIDLGERYEDQEQAEPLYELALANAQRALALDSTSADAHLMIAVASGRIALLRGPFSAAGLVKDAYAHAHRAVALADSMPVALYVIGRTHKKLMEKSWFARFIAGLTFAERDSIPVYFARALEVSHGNMIQCRVEYADYLLNEAEDTTAAVAMLEAALALPLRDENDAPAKQRAREMIGGLSLGP